MNIPERLKELRANSGFTQQEIADNIGMPVTTYRRYEIGLRNPVNEILVSIADFFNTSTDYILGRTDNPTFTREGNITESNNTLHFRELPIFDVKTAAGTGQYINYATNELMQVDNSVPKSASYGVVIAGDSMTPKYPDGSTIWIKVQRDMRDGQVGLFIINGDCFCKVLRKAGKSVWLESTNKKYDPIFITEHFYQSF